MIRFHYKTFFSQLIEADISKWNTHLQQCQNRLDAKIALWEEQLDQAGQHQKESNNTTLLEIQTASAEAITSFKGDLQKLTEAQSSLTQDVTALIQNALQEIKESARLQVDSFKATQKSIQEQNTQFFSDSIAGVKAEYDKTLKQIKEDAIKESHAASQAAYESGKSFFSKPYFICTCILVVSIFFGSVWMAYSIAQTSNVGTEETRGELRDRD